MAAVVMRAVAVRVAAQAIAARARGFKFCSMSQRYGAILRIVGSGEPHERRGIRLASGGNASERANGSWWSSSLNGSGAFVRDLYSQYMDVNRYVNNLGDGFSVLCEKDAE